MVSQIYRKSHIIKNANILILKKRIKEYLELSGTHGKQKIGQDGHKLSLSRSHAAIFEILIFRPKPAARILKNAKNVFFFTENAQKRPKMKISKIAAWGLERPNLCPFWPIFTFPNLPDSLKYSFLCEKLTFFDVFFNMGFPIHFRYFAKTPFTFAAAKIKPLGVERWLSPFWKEEA